jgi:hypothetical protein
VSTTSRNATYLRSAEMPHWFKDLEQAFLKANNIAIAGWPLAFKAHYKKKLTDRKKGQIL